MAVVCHELTEIRRLLELSTDIGVEKGTLMHIMMSTILEETDSAIEQINAMAFGRLLEQ